MRVQQREFWNGQPEALRELFTLTKAAGVRARCVLWSHPLGWELRLDVNRTFVRSQVTRGSMEADTTAVEWRAAMVDEGWQ